MRTYTVLEQVRMMKKFPLGVSLAVFGLSGSALSLGQVPDLVNALDAGGRTMGAGGAFYATDANTYSALSNPANLGFINSSQFGIAFRNLPTSRQRVTGSFTNRTFNGEEFFGKRAITHVGYATPVATGTIGLSFTTGGYLRNQQAGTGLANGQLRVDNYFEETISQTDFFTISYGRNSGQTNYGFGIVVANQYIKNESNLTIVDPQTNQTVGTQQSNVSGNGTGLGAVVGISHTPVNNPDLNVSFSLRTPISLEGNTSTEAIYDRVPGKATLGLAMRTDGRFGSDDFMVYGFQADYYFGGQSNRVIPRKNHLVLGGGLEYNLFKFDARWPIRFGVQMAPSGGAGFDERNALTFGLGYRPYSNKYAVDLNFASPTGGGPVDMSLGITYAVGGVK